MIECMYKAMWLCIYSFSATPPDAQPFNWSIIGKTPDGLEIFPILNMHTYIHTGILRTDDARVLFTYPSYPDNIFVI